MIKCTQEHVIKTDFLFEGNIYLSLMHHEIGYRQSKPDLKEEF